MYRNSVLPSQTQTQEHTYTDLVESEDTSSHTYTKPVKKRSVRKPVTPSPAHRTTTDGDSGTGTMSPDQHLPEESDRTPPLPPRSYVNYEFDIPPPTMQLRPSTSADKLAGTKPTRQCSSCIILPGPSTGSTTASYLLLHNSETELNTSVNCVTDQLADRLEVHLDTCDSGRTVMG